MANQDISMGETITEEMLTWKRPGTGISPRDLKKVMGMKSKRDISRDDILIWEDVE